MRRIASAGFSLIELVIVLTVMGLVLGFGAPGFGRYMDDLAVKGAADRIASTLRMTRTRALATRTNRVVLFQAGVSGTDYRVEVGGVVKGGWTLPKRISYAWLSGTITAVTMTPDGRCSTSGLIIVQNTRGVRDTVSVLSSGLVLTQ